ncbi:DEAD domain-containing protein [Raphanus sativus]|nr:DEAD domain-containing protein [Raphanus sativus]
MAENLFNLDSSEPDTDKEMTMTKAAVQSKGNIADHKSIKKKKQRIVSGGDEIVNIENSKVNDGSRSHEKERVNSDDDGGVKRGTGKRKRFDDCDLVDIITMETKKKDEIMRDPLALRDSEKYYKRIEKDWKRGYFLYEEKISKDKEGESDEEASDLEEEIRVDKIYEWIDFLVRDLEYLATGQNNDVKKNDSKKKSSKKKKLSVEDVKTNITNAVSDWRTSDSLREKFKEKGIEVLFPIQATIFDMVLDDTDLVGRARTGQGSLKHESQQKELKRASLTSQAREIKWLKHKLGERYEKLADIQESFHIKEQETNQTRVDFPIKKEKVSVVVSESETTSQLLGQANEIIKRQYDEINTLQRALKEKEEEIEISIVAKRLEQEKLRETDVNLKKQMEDWLITHDEVSKLQEEIEWEHFDVKGEELRKEAESINCQKETFSMYLRGKFDNIPEEKDSLRNLHKQKLDNNDGKNLLNKMKRLEGKR